MTPTAAKALAEELRQALERLAGVCGARATACVRAIGANLWDPEWSAWNHAMSAARYARVLRPSAGQSSASPSWTGKTYRISATAWSSCGALAGPRRGA